MLNSSRDGAVLVVAVEGSAKSMGEQHGEELREEIRVLYETRKSLILRSGACSETMLERLCLTLWRSIEEYAPFTSEEVRGVASAAGLSPWHMVVAGGYTDVLDVASGSDESASECTIAVSGADRWMVGTWDSHPEARDAMVILKRVPNHGPSTVSLTTAGWPCQFGLNSAGLGFGITNLTPRRATTEGLVYIASIAEASAHSSVWSATEWLRSAPAASGHSYVLLDRFGAMLTETSVTGTSQSRCWEPIVEANHYTSSLDDNGCYPFLDGSRRRAEEMTRELHRFEASPESFLQWLPESRKVLRRDPSGAALTCAAYFISPDSGGIWVVPGESIGREPMVFYSLPNT